MSNENKINQLEQLIIAQEQKLEKSILLNKVLYSIIAVIFVGYAIYLPHMVSSMVDEKQTPDILASLLREQIPANNEIIAMAEKKIPVIINDGFDQLESNIPQLQKVVGAEILKLNDRAKRSLSAQVKPQLKSIIAEKRNEIKTMLDNVKDGQETKTFQDFVESEIDNELNKAIVKLRGKLDGIGESLEKFNTSKTLTETELAQKQLLMAYLRLSDDPSFRKELTEDIVDNLQEFYRVK